MTKANVCHNLYINLVPDFDLIL